MSHFQQVLENIFWKKEVNKGPVRLRFWICKAKMMKPSLPGPFWSLNETKSLYPKGLRVYINKMMHNDFIKV